MKWLMWAHRLALVGYIMMWINTVFFLVLGVLAAVLGGGWAQWGAGLGGGWGLPALIFELPVLLGIPSLIIGVQGFFRKNRRKMVYLIFFFAPLFISFAFIIVAHALDPCALKIWTLNDHWGTQKLCERFGNDINIHTRFHLLLHVMPIFILLMAYRFLFRKIYRTVQTEQGVGALT
jgi:hypothetical protein